MFSVRTAPPPGVGKPIVTSLLRAMLYLHLDTRVEGDLLYQKIAAELSGRNDIAMRAALLTRCQQVIEKPWAYPALLDTKTCRKAYLKLQPYVSASDSVANTASDPWSSALIGGVLTKLLGATAAFGYGLVTYYGGKSKTITSFMRVVSPPNLRFVEFRNRRCEEHACR